MRWGRVLPGVGVIMLLAPGASAQTRQTSTASGQTRDVDGRSIAWIDVPAMLADLSSPPRALA